VLFASALFTRGHRLSIYAEIFLTNLIETSEKLFYSVFAKLEAFNRITRSVIQLIKATKQSSFCLKINAKIASPDKSGSQ
jgi:hypothetical protein